MTTPIAERATSREVLPVTVGLMRAEGMSQLMIMIKSFVIITIVGKEKERKNKVGTDMIEVGAIVIERRQATVAVRGIFLRVMRAGGMTGAVQVHMKIPVIAKNLDRRIFLKNTIVSVTVRMKTEPQFMVSPLAVTLGRMRKAPRGKRRRREDLVHLLLRMSEWRRKRCSVQERMSSMKRELLIIRRRKKELQILSLQ